MTTTTKNKGLNVTLWVGQAVLAALFLASGLSKSLQSMQQLEVTLKWVSDVPAGVVRFIGICEILGAVGLLLPSMIRVKPNLSAWAAAGLAAIMMFAFVFHLYEGQLIVLPFVFAVAVVSASVAWARFSIVPIMPKQ